MMARYPDGDTPHVDSHASEALTPNHMVYFYHEPGKTCIEISRTTNKMHEVTPSACRAG